MPKGKRTLRTYVFHVPDTPEYQPLIRILDAGPYPGGIRGRSKFVREVLMDALGLRERPWKQTVAAAASSKPSGFAEPNTHPPAAAPLPGETVAKEQPEPAVAETAANSLPPDVLAVLAAGVRKVHDWEEGGRNG